MPGRAGGYIYHRDAELLDLWLMYMYNIIKYIYEPIRLAPASSRRWVTWATTPTNIAAGPLPPIPTLLLLELAGGWLCGGDEGSRGALHSLLS